MKKSLLSLLLIFYCTILSAQNMVETVHLNNGSIIKGTIIEQSKESVKIQTSDGSVFVYSMDKVEKILKEPVNSYVTQIPQIQNKIFFENRMERSNAGFLRMRGMNYMESLTDPQVKELIGEEIYEKTYVGAKKQFFAGTMILCVPGLVCTVCGLTFSLVGIGTGDSVFYTIGGAFLGAAAGIFIPVGLPLVLIGNSRLNWIVENYNKSVQGVSLSVMPSITRAPIGIGTNSYAYGATLKLNF